MWLQLPWRSLWFEYGLDRVDNKYGLIRSICLLASSSFSTMSRLNFLKKYRKRCLENVDFSKKLACELSIIDCNLSFGSTRIWSAKKKQSVFVLSSRKMRFSTHVFRTSHSSPHVAHSLPLVAARTHSFPCFSPHRSAGSVSGWFCCPIITKCDNVYLFLYHKSISLPNISRSFHELHFLSLQNSGALFRYDFRSATVSRIILLCSMLQ